MVGENEDDKVLLQGKEQVRERDLKRHFKGDGEAIETTQVKVNLPENLKSWEVTDKLRDYQLKVALNYLNGVSTAVTGRNTARAQ